MPAQKRVGPDDLGQFAEAFSAQHLALDGQASTLVVVEQNAALAELFSEYLILSQKILVASCWSLLIQPARIRSSSCQGLSTKFMVD